jgi:hypothetical protein
MDSGTLKRRIHTYASNTRHWQSMLIATTWDKMKNVTSKFLTSR